MSQNCCDYGCDQSPGCPARTTRLTARLSTSCCHRPDCADTHCPGRPDRPPRIVALQVANSDGSSPGTSALAHETPPCGLRIDWLDELRYWAVVWAVTAASVGAIALLLGYFIRR